MLGFTFDTFQATYTYFGIKRRTKEQLQILMYSKEIEEWKEEFSAEEARNEAHRYTLEQR